MKLKSRKSRPLTHLTTTDSPHEQSAHSAGSVGRSARRGNHRVPLDEGAPSRRDLVPRALTDERPPGDGASMAVVAPQPCSQAELSLASRLVTQTRCRWPSGLGSRILAAGPAPPSTVLRFLTLHSESDGGNWIDRRPRGVRSRSSHFHRLPRSDFAESRRQEYRTATPSRTVSSPATRRPHQSPDQTPSPVSSVAALTV